MQVAKALLGALLLTELYVPDAVGAEPVAAAQRIAPQVWMVQAQRVEGREPDGNSVVFEAPSGLIVVDSGRHRWHRQALLQLATSRGKPIVALLNSHWHLDHTSGNQSLRERYPGLQVYATDAIEGALRGFLADSAARTPRQLADATLSETMRADLSADLEQIQHGAWLRPDVTLNAARLLTLGGRAIKVYVARDAATAADLWLVDEASRTVVLGDLMTLPVPYLDTACPDGWAAALAQVDAQSFERAVPGHGPLLRHADVSLYRHVFGEFIACSRSSRPAHDCAVSWSGSIAPLLAGDTALAQVYAEYYADLLRANGGRSAWCAEPNS